ncbi:unnamed protein product [Durusdinium trenchii]|uniref:Uncharacterized protein n=1 Tax=Durusdinium trenchii TaxID=1381693 RepID=A0ABP0QI15_9DINO
MSIVPHEPTGFSKSNLYDGMRSVLVPVGPSEEEVTMDPEKGPMVMQLDGTMTHLQKVRGTAGAGQVWEKLWPQMTATEQTCALCPIASTHGSRGMVRIDAYRPNRCACDDKARQVRSRVATVLTHHVDTEVATPHAKLYRELAEKELELKDLEKQHEALVELQRQLPLMRNRLQGFQKARASREEAVRSLIEERQAELLEVNHEIQVLEAIAEASERIYPDLKTAQPLGESLHLAVEDMKNLHSSKPKGLSMRQPASWPSTFILADLMLACSEISATDAFISSTPFQGVDRMRLDAPGRDNEFLGAAAQTGTEALKSRSLKRSQLGRTKTAIAAGRFGILGLSIEKHRQE